MAHNEELKALASQLKRPQGTKGVEIGDMMHETNLKMTVHSIDKLEILDNNSVLELGHGNCGHLPYLLEQKNDLTYYGLEVSELMHKEAQRINEAYIGKKQASFHLYNGIHVPFPDQYFDRIFTVNTLYFWSDPTLLLSELYRVTKTNGTVNITFAQKSFMQQLPFVQFGFELYDNEKAEQLINTTSFKVVDLETRTETIKSKTGELVNREFTTISLKK